MRLNKISLLLVFLTLSGCIDTRSPFATFKSLVYSAEKSELEDFAGCFDKSVRDQLGTSENMQNFAKAVSGIEGRKLGPAVLTHVEQGYQGWSRWGDILRKFTVDLLNATGEVIATTDQTCNVWVDRVLDSTCGHSPDPDCDQKYRYVETQDCRILTLSYAP